MHATRSRSTVVFAGPLLAEIYGYMALPSSREGWSTLVCDTGYSRCYLIKRPCCGFATLGPRKIFWKLPLPIFLVHSGMDHRRYSLYTNCCRPKRSLYTPPFGFGAFVLSQLTLCIGGLVGARHDRPHVVWEEVVRGPIAPPTSQAAAHGLAEGCRRTPPANRAFGPHESRDTRMPAAWSSSSAPPGAPAVRVASLVPRCCGQRSSRCVVA